MKTLKIDLQHLHNEEHFQFQTEFKDSVTKYGADNLDISEPYQAYLPVYNQEQEALQKIRKSAVTKELADADRNRDNIFRGFADAVRSGLNHFNPDKQYSAMRIQVLLDQYGNVAHKPYDEETASLTKLNEELTTTYKNDVTVLALTDWVQELNARNMAFDALRKIRFNEDAGKTDLRMILVRDDMDAAYRAITARLDALMLLNGSAKYEAFVRELNARVDKYANALAMRKGRAAKDKAEEEAKK